MTEPPFDVVLTDLTMPTLTGQDLIRWLSENHPETRCVLMSGYGDELDDCPVTTMCLKLRKPFSPPQALAVVELALGLVHG